MKGLATATVITILMLILTYLSIAFIIQEWNVSIWDKGERFIIVFILFICLCFSPAIIYTANNP